MTTGDPEPVPSADTPQPPRTPPEPVPSLDAVRAVERVLAERAEHRTEAESTLAAARTAAAEILDRARDQGLAEAAALHAQRLADAERQAAAIVADAHARAQREAAAILRQRAQLTAELLALVLPATGRAPADAGRAGV